MSIHADAPGGDSDKRRTALLVARLYHLHGVRQREIGMRLGMSQARVSRILRQAEALGYVHTVVAVPEGLHPELEERIEQRYSLSEVHVVEIPDVYDLSRHLGQVAADYLAETIAGATTVGFTSWSRTLQELAAAMPTSIRSETRHVVEMLGDLGSPLFQHAAARSTQTLADRLGAEPVFLRTPGIHSTTAHRARACADMHVRRALHLLDDLDLALVGVGPAEVHSTLRAGDGYFTDEQLRAVRDVGAVAQLNQRFIDAQGDALSTPLDELVVGSSLDQISRAGRRVLVAGGPEKDAALLAALRGGWADVLITDLRSATALDVAT